MAKRRLQLTVSGAPLEYLEQYGFSDLVSREVFAVRGLARILDEHLAAHKGEVDAIRDLHIEWGG